jgi:hypothetical protein
VITTGNVDGVGGENNALEIETTATTGSRRARRNTTFEVGFVYLVRLRVYIPSTNPNLDSFRILYNGTTFTPYQTPTQDTWVEFSFVTNITTSEALEFKTAGGGSDDYTGEIGELAYLKDITVTKLGALAALPMDDGANSVLRDLSDNRNDALLSETGIQHLLPQVNGSVRGDALDATGGAYLLRAGNIIDPATVITGVTVDGVYHAADGAQNDTYRRIRYITSGSDVLIQRSDGSTHQTIATATPSDTTDFNLVVHTQRI